jgi:DHA2 family multidrug resistance protein-like MFS transporter
MLIAARALLGIAGATVAPSTLSLITTLFQDPRQRTFAVGIWITSYSAGAAIGPLAGGALLEHFWWGSVFLIGLPVSALLLVAGPRLLPEYRDPAGGRLDLVSAALSVLAVLAVVYGVKRSFDGIGLVAIAGGLVVGAVFVRRQQRSDDPLLDLALLSGSRFRVVLGANLIGFLVLFGIDLLIAQYLQSVLGLSPWEAGLWSVPSALAFIAGALLTSRLTRAVTPSAAMIGGLVVAVASFAVVALADGLYGVVAGSFVFSLGLAPLFTLAADLMSSSAPPERAGAASALNETSSELGGALGIALLGSLAAAIFGPGTIGAAAGDPAAREAFTTALHVTAGVAALLVAVAAAALMCIREPRAGLGVAAPPTRAGASA